MNRRHDAPAARQAGRADVAVLGAGIMGCCIALELAQRGRTVDLFDFAAVPMTGASLHNEGKLHLGFVYANDPSKKTHGLMLQGSLAFSRILERLTGFGPGSCLPSQPFHYFIPTDSQLDLAAIGAHFDAVAAAVRAVTRSAGDRYLGLTPDRWCERNSPRLHGSLFSPRTTLGSFKTEERSVSTAAVADILRRAIREEPRVNFIGNTTVVEAGRLPGGGVAIASSRDGVAVVRNYPAAANCLWDDRIRVDRTAGIHAGGPWLFRYKVTVRVAAPAASRLGIPSATGILGRYGDVVNHSDGSCYISWYPSCKIAQSADEDGRALHAMVHRGLIARCVRKVTAGFPALAGAACAIPHRRFIRETIREMAAYVPSMSSLLRGAEKKELGGGVILARGATDIDDPGSLLHQRSEIGPVAHGPYVTVNTGKYCMGPLFAVQAADMIADALR